MVASPQQMTQAPKLKAMDWRAVLRHVAVSRALDDLEEFTLLRDRKVLYQFSARGHDLTQVLLSTQLTGSQDGVGGYIGRAPYCSALDCRWRKHWHRP